MSEPTTEWYVYDHTVDGLFFKALRERISPGLAGRLKALGIDLSGKPKSVPHEAWKKALELAATELFQGTPDERFRQLGNAVLLRYHETLMGKAVVSVMKLLGPRRILHRVQSILRSGNNYIEATLTQIAETKFDCTVNECNGNPNYIVGVVEQGLIISGAKSPKVTVAEFDGHRARLSIEWS